MTIDTCDRCGNSYNGLPAHRFARYEIPDEYDHICTDCAEEANTHTPDDMTDGQLVAAIMDDSLGYASPHHATRHVEQYREGDDPFVYCERAVSCFPADPDDYDEDDMGSFSGLPPGDLDALIESARQTWCAATEEKREELEEFAEAWAEAEDPDEIGGISLLSRLPDPGSEE
jgi:hypothetical protein